MFSTETIIVEFIIWVDDLIPELICRGGAYRKAKQSCLCNERVKIVKCPHCRERLADVPISTKVELYQNPQKINKPCHSYMRCTHCKNTVGLMMKTA
jgi:hypothetical protein